MKKVLLVMGVLLVALSVMAPAPEKPEKLKHENTGWDYLSKFDEPNVYLVYVDGLSCQFGIATAGEHADFRVALVLTGKKYDYETGVWDTWAERTTENLAITKVDGAPKVDGFIAIESGWVGWNGDDDGDGYIVQEVGVSLVTPSGNEMTSLPSFTLEQEMIILGPGFDGCVPGGEIPCPGLPPPTHQ